MIDTISICAIFPWENNKPKKQYLRKFREKIPFCWSLNISNKSRWRSEIDNLFQEKNGSGALIEFEPVSDIYFVAKALQYTYRKAKAQNKKIFFRNLIISNLMKFIVQQEKSKDFSFTMDRRLNIESILSVDKNMTISTVLSQSNEIVMDLIECEIKFQKILKVIKVGGIL
jgi:hypothetical protein